MEPKKFISNPFPRGIGRLDLASRLAMLVSIMNELEPPDRHVLSAAIGWIELGNPAEALSELDRASPECQQHPDVLDARWWALAELKRWQPALAVAGQLVEHAPDHSSGWLHRAYALRRVPDGGLQQAWEALLPAAEKFPKELLIAFNLACYACQMHQLDEARRWLKRAADMEGGAKVRRMALADPDLKPLWPELRSQRKS